MNRYLLLASWVAVGTGCLSSAPKPADVPEVGVHENEQAAKQHEQSAAEQLVQRDQRRVGGDRALANADDQRVANGAACIARSQLNL